MSVETTGGIIAAILGAFGFGFNQHRRIKRLEERDNAECSLGEKMDERVTRLERKAPSGNDLCASNEDVELLFKKIDIISTQVTKTHTILDERLPKKV